MNCSAYPHAVPPLSSSEKEIQLSWDATGMTACKTVMESQKKTDQLLFLLMIDLDRS
eukprot:m.93935 g.93935  ORF g.93935 m.93935 type:complete len:57 (+) comp12193_c0_seq4:1048-1218(+)